MMNLNQEYTLPKLTRKLETSKGDGQGQISQVIKITYGKEIL